MNRLHFSLVVLSLAGLPALAQTGGGYDLTWNSIDGGGEMFSTGGGYELGGMIGQADAGELADGGYALRGGFWSIPGFATPTVGDDTCHAANTDSGIPCGKTTDCPPKLCDGGDNVGMVCVDDGDCPDGSCVDAICGLKSRYVTVTPVNPVGGELTAIRMEILSNPVDPMTVGHVWWAGVSTPGNIPNPPGANLTGAEVECTTTPNSQTWTAGDLHLYGTPIVPGSEYGVRLCEAGGVECSDELVVATGKWGDVLSPFGGGSQPNFGDISSVVDKFRNVASAPDMPRSDLVGPGNPGDPNSANQNVNFGDISADVDAFRGFVYPFTVPPCP